MPVLALVMPVSKLAEGPHPINSDTTISFWDIIEIILKMIIDGAKAMFQRPEISRQAGRARESGRREYWLWTSTAPA
jgi:hypothetical protein